jgi:hypothetical protein
MLLTAAGVYGVLASVPSRRAKRINPVQLVRSS